MTKPIKKKKKSIVKKTKKLVKSRKKTAKKIMHSATASTGAETDKEAKKVNWAALPGEEPTEQEYLDEDYPEDEGFGTEETKVKKPSEDDYEKLPSEVETGSDEEEI